MTPVSRAPGVLVTLALLASPRLAAAAGTAPLAGVLRLPPGARTRLIIERSGADAFARRAALDHPVGVTP